MVAVWAIDQPWRHVRVSTDLPPTSIHLAGQAWASTCIYMSQSIRKSYVGAYKTEYVADVHARGTLHANLRRLMGSRDSGRWRGCCHDRRGCHKVKGVSGPILNLQWYNCEGGLPCMSFSRIVVLNRHGDLDSLSPSPRGLVRRELPFIQGCMLAYLVTRELM